MWCGIEAQLYREVSGKVLYNFVRRAEMSRTAMKGNEI
jgi:hypothetical protein